MGRPGLQVGTWGEISVREHGTGFRASCRVRDFDGRVRSVARHGETKGKATSALRAALRDRVRGAFGSAEITADTTVDELSALWLAQVEADPDRAEGTKDHYKWLVARKVLPAFGGLKVREVTGSRVDAVLSALAVESPSTARGVRSVLSGMMRLAVRHDAAPVNPVLGLTRIGGKSGKGKARALTDGEAARLFEKLEADPRARELDLVDLCRFLDGTGCRIGEASALTVDKFDLSAGLVRVDSTVRNGRIQGRPKSDAGNRTLTLPPHVVELVRRRLEDPAVPTGVAVFAGPLGRLRDMSNVTGDLRAVFDRAGFGWVTSHTFRKTVATRLDAAGHSARAIADQLGHGNPSMTQDVYMGRKVANSGAADVLAR